MINLLPPDIKQSYRYAQRNVELRHWLNGVLLAIVGLIVIGTYGMVTIQQSIDSNKHQSTLLSETLQKAQLNETKKQVGEINSNLKLAQKVLSQEILFSKLLKQIATAMPDNANLTSLDIPAVTSGSTLDVTAEATDYTAATQVQVNLADPKNQLFAKADIQNITCDATADSANPDFPCQITLRAQFAKNNPFLFVNQKQAKS